jgi:CubicO group peptidase (beta-lactamase class C family)
VTLRHLVTHTSGIPSVGDGSAPYWTDKPPSEEAMLKALAGPLQFPPGSKSEYSNAGMALAGVVLARAAKQPYRAYMEAHVLRPIGMRSLWDRSAVPDAVRVAGRGAGGAVDPPTWTLGAFEPAGGLWASLDDMTALARFVHGSDADRVLPAASRKLMFTDDASLPGAHGVAWIAGPGGIGHAGSTTDYTASIVSSPDKKITGIVLTSGGALELVDCAAIALARAVASGGAPASCAATAPKDIDRAALVASLDRLVAFLARPDETTARAAFAPVFLAAVPLDQLIAMTRKLEAQAGACSRHELPADARSAGGRVTIVCAKAKLVLDYHVEEAPPHRLDLAAVTAVE